MTQAHLIPGCTQPEFSGEQLWGPYLRCGRTADAVPAPDFAGVMESALPARHAIVLRLNRAIASQRTWAAMDIMISDIGLPPGKSKAVLHEEPHPRLPQRFGLVALSVCDRHVEGSQSAPGSAIRLYFALAREQVRYYRDMLDLLQDHCDARSIGDRKLSSIATVRSQLGDACRRLRLLEEWTAAETGAASPTPALAHELRGLADALCKLGGGRAFLSGGLWEAAAMFEILANLYAGYNDARHLR